MRGKLAAETNLNVTPQVLLCGSLKMGADVNDKLAQILGREEFQKMKAEKRIIEELYG